MRPAGPFAICGRESEGGEVDELVAPELALGDLVHRLLLVDAVEQPFAFTLHEERRVSRLVWLLLRADDASDPRFDGNVGR